MSKLTQFGKFVGRYAGELRDVASLLGTVFRSLPIDPADRSEVDGILNGLNTAADRIEASLSGILADGRIDRDDLKIVLREILPEILPDLIGGLVEKQTRARASAPAATPAAPAPARPARVRNRLPKAGEQTTGD